MTLEEAKLAVIDHCQKEIEGEHDLEIMQTEIVEHKDYWILYCQTKKHIQTRDPRYALTPNNPYLVSRGNGEIFPLGPGLLGRMQIRSFEEKGTVDYRAVFEEFRALE